MWRLNKLLVVSCFLFRVFLNGVFDDVLMMMMIDFEVANPQMYQLATTSLDIEQQTQLMEIIRQAEKNVMAR